MYTGLQLAIKYFFYYLTAANGKGHGIHSPFVFEFIKKVLNNKEHVKAFDEIEKLRQQLLRDRTLLTIQDFGAGSSLNSSSQRTVASVAKNTAKSKKYARLLYRLVNYYRPQTILELGTSLGISTAYIAAANPQAKVITIEGATAVASSAQENFKKLLLENIELVTGNFDDRLPAVITRLPAIDFAFIDGNHRQESTLKYFEQMLKKTNNNSILVFDDIHWSPGMEHAWQTIQQHEAVQCTIDLFFLGIVFFRQEFKEKQHFVIRY